MIPSLHEYDAIEKVLQGYVDAVANHDPDLVQKVFHPKATLSGYAHLPGAPAEGTFIFENAVDLLTNFMRNTPPITNTSPDYTGRIVSIQVTGLAAVAMVIEENLEGRDFINHFQLQKVDGQWFITSKVLVSEPSGG